jgi:lactobin A/cerein 7B family class IIb bacteriocin
VIAHLLITLKLKIMNNLVELKKKEMMEVEGGRIFLLVGMLLGYMVAAYIEGKQQE